MDKEITIKFNNPLKDAKDAGDHSMFLNVLRIQEASKKFSSYHSGFIGLAPWDPDSKTDASTDDKPDYRKIYYNFMY